MSAFICVIFLAFEVWVFTSQEPFRIKTLRKQLSIVLSIVMFICSKYIWKRLNVLIRTKSVFHFGFALKALVLIFLLMAQVTIFCLHFLVQTDPPILSYLASFGLGSVILLSYCMIVYDICSYIYRRLIFSGSRSFRSYNALEVKIRSLLSLVSALGLIVTGTMAVNNLTVELVTVPVKGLSSHINGTTIIQISDIHLGPFNGKSTLISLVKNVNQLQGDIVVITGDLVDASVENLRDAVLPLKKLKARYGVYYITGTFLLFLVSVFDVVVNCVGNHEYYTGDVDNWIAEMPKLNVTPLINQRVCLPAIKKSCEGGLYLAGLEDLATRTLR